MEPPPQAPDASGAHNELLARWEDEQRSIRERIRQVDDPQGFLEEGAVRVREEDAHDGGRVDGDAGELLAGLRLVAGADLSMGKASDDEGAATLVVCEFPSLKVVYEATSTVRVTEAYIPGFLAFREAPCILRLLTSLRASRPDLYPQVLLLDGNGVLQTGCYTREGSAVGWKWGAAPAKMRDCVNSRRSR
ncbi:endonuclease V-domain-containing protein [Baffinella frigidus]|nr:endonuclease V-domain-containing protein [Cryptophyta sp. CCMP2293]